jgi:hypothetical protein
MAAAAGTTQTLEQTAHTQTTAPTFLHTPAPTLSQTNVRILHSSQPSCWTPPCPTFLRHDTFVWCVRQDTYVVKKLAPPSPKLRTQCTWLLALACGVSSNTHRGLGKPKTSTSKRTPRPSMQALGLHTHPRTHTHTMHTQSLCAAEELQGPTSQSPHTAS